MGAMTYKPTVEPLNDIQRLQRSASKLQLRSLMNLFYHPDADDDTKENERPLLVQDYDKGKEGVSGSVLAWSHLPQGNAMALAAANAEANAERDRQEAESYPAEVNEAFEFFKENPIGGDIPPRFIISQLISQGSRSMEELATAFYNAGVDTAAFSKALPTTKGQRIRARLKRFFTLKGWRKR